LLTLLVLHHLHVLEDSIVGLLLEDLMVDLLVVVIKAL